MFKNPKSLTGTRSEKDFQSSHNSLALTPVSLYSTVLWNVCISVLASAKALSFKKNKKNGYNYIIRVGTQ